MFTIHIDTTTNRIFIRDSEGNLCIETKDFNFAKFFTKFSNENIQLLAKANKFGCSMETSKYYNDLVTYRNNTFLQHYGPDMPKYLVATNKLNTVS